MKAFFDTAFRHGEVHPHLLGKEICSPRHSEGRILKQVRFYTVIHSPDRKPRMHAHMTRRLEAMRANGVRTFSRPLKYSMQWIKKGDDCIEIMKGREKGIGVKMALDIYMLAQKGGYDIATVVSTDTDLDEAIREVINLRMHDEKAVSGPQALRGAGSQVGAPDQGVPLPVDSGLAQQQDRKLSLTRGMLMS